MWRGFLIICLILCFLNSGVTQSEKYTFFHTTYTTDDGLSSRFIHDIYQDSRNFIWAATDYGINRFDGNQFKVYGQVNAPFQSDNINYIREDQNGNLWLIDNEYQHFGKLCTWVRTSIDIFDPVTEIASTFEAYTNGKAPFRVDNIFNIYQDEEQQLWITTDDGQLYVYGTEFIKTSIPQGLGEKVIFYPLAAGEIMALASSARRSAL